MAELTTVTGGDTIASATFGNPVIDRVVSRYATEAARDAAVPIPLAGDVGYIVDIDQFQIYDGTGWRNYVHVASTGVALIERPDRASMALDARVALAGDTTLTAGVGVFEDMVTIGSSGVGPTRIPPTGTRAVWLVANCYLDYSLGAFAPEYHFRIFDVEGSGGNPLATTKQTATGTGRDSIGLQGWAPRDGTGYKLQVARDVLNGTTIVREPRITQIWIDAP